MSNRLRYLTHQAKNLIGYKVRVYRNLNVKCWSLLSSERNSLSYGRIVGYADSLVLTNCYAKVSSLGREQVRKTRKKSVHAWIEGTVVDASLIYQRATMPEPIDVSEPILYNPYDGDGPFFQLKDGTPVFELDKAWFSRDFKVHGIPTKPY